MALQCGGCGFNFEELKLTLDVQELLGEEVNGLRENSIRLYCPACGKESWLDLRPYGIFYREKEKKLFRWRSATTTLRADEYQISIGAMVLKIPEERMELISVQRICYPAVPAFRQLDGTLSIPKWPVKKEYLSFIDTEKDVTPEIVQDMHYRLQLYLKGLETPEQITLPLVPVQYGKAAQGENAVFKGVHLVLWPNIRYRDWKRYFLRFGCAAEHVGDIINQFRDVKIFAYASQELGSEKKDWIPVDKIALNGYTRFGCVESRPQWIAVEFESRGQLEGGGVWAIDRAEDSYPYGMLTIAVDFGTSNTFIGWRKIDAQPGEDSEQPIPIGSCDQFIIHGSDLPTVLDFADTWPPRRGFGRNQALLPSEILTRERLRELRRDPAAIGRWKPVVDYGIPSSGLEVWYPEAEHIIAEFKWKDLIPDEAFRQHASGLQIRYLEFLLLFTLAQLATRNMVRNSAQVSFSYPLAFSQEDLESFQEVISKAAESVKQQTGIAITTEVSMDEARAAASSMGQPSPRYFAFLYVDIGGGSSDIALEMYGEREERRHYAYVCSFQYAGGGLVQALAAGGCLRPDYDLGRFRRVIREVGQVTELMRVGTVFHPHRINAINSKTSYFYSYLMEFLARLLAAHILTGEWAEELTEEEKEKAQREGYLVALYPFGNGWGFGHFIDSRYARDVFSQKLMDRANQILKEARQQREQWRDVPSLVIKGQDLRIADPKWAVAIGLLRGGGQAAGEREENWSFRTILGWTTCVGTTRRIPWYLPITDRANPWTFEKLLEGEDRLPSNQILDCCEDEWPTFPEGLPTPHRLDADLNQTRRHLWECVRLGADWFVQSPFHILLEKLFKPKLRELV
ncbi:MAG: hypothetical protein QXS54_00935 [Candidatus Methanomethylicaceae archaeon]